MNYILQDNLLGLEAKILLLKLFIAKVREEFLGNTIGKIMKNVFGYGKHLVYVKEHQSDKSKEY